MTTLGRRIVESFTPASLIHLMLLIVAIVGLYWNFEYRMRTIEYWRVDHERAQNEQLRELQRRDLVDAQLAEIKRRLESIERKLDRQSQ